MQKKTMFKTLSVFTLALFVMSMTGAAATCTLCKANTDTFNFNPSLKSGNVLKNDKGSGLKIASISKCSNGGKVTMKSNGSFSYKPASCSKTNIKESFTYKVKNNCGKYSTAKVTIIYRCR
ncbi:MAG: Ig-like domain-containing protein [Methanosarcina sp.]